MYEDETDRGIVVSAREKDGSCVTRSHRVDTPNPLEDLISSHKEIEREKDPVAAQRAFFLSRSLSLS